MELLAGNRLDTKISNSPKVRLCFSAFLWLKGFCCFVLFFLKQSNYQKNSTNTFKLWEDFRA